MKGLIYTLTFVGVVSFIPTNNAITQSKSEIGIDTTTTTTTNTTTTNPTTTGFVKDTNKMYPDTVLMNKIDSTIVTTTNTIAVGNYELTNSNAKKRIKIENKIELLDYLEKSLDSLENQ